MSARDLVIRLDGESASTRRLWAKMLDLCVREQAVVGVVAGHVASDPRQSTERTFEGVLLEIDESWLRVQPVDEHGLPAAASEYVPRVSVDHVVVYGTASPGLLALYDGATLDERSA